MWSRPRTAGDRRRVILAVLLAVCCASSTGLFAGTYSVLGVEAIDGDSIQVRFPSGLVVEVRLLSVDCPEHGQRVSDKAKEFTHAFVAGRPLVVQTGTEERDQYNRLLATASAGTSDLGIELVRKGLCVVTVIPPNTRLTDELLAAQEQAHATGLGVGGEGSPLEEPRSYRARVFRNKGQPQRALRYENHVVVGNRRSRIAHWPGCRHVEEMGEKNIVSFSSVASAVAAGYRMEKASR